MSKYEKGDDVWVKATYLMARSTGGHYLQIDYSGFVQAVAAGDKQLKPDVTFPWSPAKAKKKGAKK